MTAPPIAAPRPTPVVTTSVVNRSGVTPPSLPATATSPVAVTTLNGMSIVVQGQAEADYYAGAQQRYLEQTTFTHTSDLTDLDRMLFAELEVYRCTCWLAAGRDYEQNLLGPGEHAACRKVIKENSALISTIKNDLGLTKSKREQEQFASVGTYITNLKARAREHGVKREKELTKALALTKELFSMVATYDRSDETERQKLGLETPDDVLDWVRSVMKPEFDAIDQHFRTHQQRTWVREL